MTNDAPLKIFAEHSWKANNIVYHSRDGMPFVVGQRVYGTWVNVDGKTFYTEGKIVHYEKTGYWVEDNNGCITPVKLFWAMHFMPD